MAGLNKVILIGHLGKDPELRDVAGNKVANFTLATSESYKDKSGEKQTVTEWHNLVLWGKIAEIAEKYLKKGSQVYVEGKIMYRSYEDKQGNKRYITDIKVHDLTMLGGKGGNSNSSKGDDIPF